MPIITGISGGPRQGAVVRFVNGISETPVVRLDLNDLEPYMSVELDLSAPTLQRAMSSTMLTDGDPVTASAFGNRIIKLDLRLGADTAGDAASALSALAVELNRTANVLMVILDTVPTFYRTYRSPDFTLAMLNHNISLSGQTIQILAEPFGLGLPQTLSGLPLHSDPTLAFGRIVDILGVLGDVETPLQIQGLGGLNDPASTVIGVRRRGVPSAVNYCVQADQFTSDGAALFNPGYDSNMSGDGLSWARVGIGPGANATGGVPMETPFPAVPDAEARGTYRLFIRCRKTDPTDSTVQVRGMYGQTFTGPSVTLPNTSNLMMVDLGDVSIPGGQDPVFDGYSGVELPVLGQSLAIGASGAGTSASQLDVDFFMLVPADDRLCVLNWSPAGYPLANVVDATNDRVYVINQNTPVSVFPSAYYFDGSLPMVSPGDNRLFIVLDATLGAADSLTYQQSFEVTYWPRYLTLATT